jgi:hypothetical protein
MAVGFEHILPSAASLPTLLGYWLARISPKCVNGEKLWVGEVSVGLEARSTAGLDGLRKKSI